MDINEDALRARFHELGRAAAEIRAAAAPLRAKYDETSQKADAVLNRMRDELKAVEAPLFALDAERAMIARALKGKTGEPPANDTDEDGN